MSIIKVLRSFPSAVKRARVWGIKGISDYLIRTYRERRILKFLIANARAHNEIPTERGITIIAHFSGSYSLSKTVRDFARSLKKAGVPFQALDTYVNDAKAAKEDFEDLLTPLADFNINRYTHIVEMFKSPLPDNLLPWANGNRRARIAFWEGEHGVLDIFPYLANGNAVIAMSDFNAEYFKKDLPAATPVYKITYPLMFPDGTVPSRAETRKKYGIAESEFVVFFNFDLGSAFRKNADGAMRAFAEAFNDIPGTRLVFKINGRKNHPQGFDALARLARELGIADRYTAIDRYLPQNELFALTAAADAYISLHRAEGFGLGIAEAMCFGIPVVVTDYSATTEFCKPDSSVPIPYTMIPIGGKEYFSSMKQWAAPDEHAASRALRRLFNDKAFRQSIGAGGKSFIKNHFSTQEFKRSIENFLSL